MIPKPIALWHEAVKTNDLSACGAILVLNNGSFRYVDEWLSPR